MGNRCWYVVLTCKKKCAGGICAWEIGLLLNLVGLQTAVTLCPVIYTDCSADDLET